MKTQTLIDKSKLLLEQEIVTEAPARIIPPLSLAADILLKFVQNFVVRLQEGEPELVKQRLHGVCRSAVGSTWI